MTRRAQVGILRSNGRAWRTAIEAGWEWAMVAEDDMVYAHGTAGQLVGLLPLLVQAMDPTAAH